MAKIRTCMICGKSYEFCNNCREYAQEPGWKILYHDEKCKMIGDLWYAYRGKEISKEDVRRAMSNVKPNIDKALEYDGTIASKEIRAIFDIKEEVADEQPKVEVEDIKVASEKQQPKKRTSKKENQESE